MAAKKLFTQIFIYFSKPLRLLYSLIIYEIVNFSFFALYSLLLLSFFLYLKSVPIYVIVHVYIHMHIHVYIHMHIHVYIHMHIHVYTCTYRFVHTLSNFVIHTAMASHGFLIG